MDRGTFTETCKRRRNMFLKMLPWGRHYIYCKNNIVYTLIYNSHESVENVNKSTTLHQNTLFSIVMVDTSISDSRQHCWQVLCFLMTLSSYVYLKGIHLECWRSWVWVWALHHRFYLWVWLHRSTVQDARTYHTLLVPCKRNNQLVGA